MYLRNIDGLGRIHIPAEAREKLNISTNEFVELECKNECLIISKRGKSPSEMISELIEKYSKQIVNGKISSKILDDLKKIKF